MARLEQLLQFYQKTPDDAFILFALAKEYENLKDDTTALEYYQKLVKIDTNYVGAYYHKAKLYERLEQMDKALQTYDNGIAIARKVGDQHSLSELMNAKLNLTFDE